MIKTIISFFALLMLAAVANAHCGSCDAGSDADAECASKCAKEKSECTADKAECDKDKAECTEDKKDCDKEKAECTEKKAECAKEKTACDKEKSECAAKTKDH